MQITREYLLYGIDYKRLRVQEMEDAIESLLGEINDAAEELKNLVNGSVRIGGETYAEILAARARAFLLQSFVRGQRALLVNRKRVWAARNSSTRRASKARRSARDR